MTNRRGFFKKVGVLGLMGGLTKTLGFRIEEDMYQNNGYSSRAIRLVSEATTIDMLGTFLDRSRRKNDMAVGRIWATIPGSFAPEDYAWVRSSGMNVFGWGSMSPTREAMLEFVAEQNGIIASNPEYFLRIDSKKSLNEINGSGKIGMLITNQESSHFNDVDDVDLFYGLGQRVSQLTYNGKNDLGCGAFVDVDSGITAYGLKIVSRMNKVGMAVDVSHCGDKTTLGGIEASSKPVLITHAACRGIAKGVPRAKTDEAIKAMAETGGVIGIPILRFMISHEEPVIAQQFADHIDYVAQLVGVEHVGIGSDQGLNSEDAAPLSYRKYRIDNAPAGYKIHTNDQYQISIEGINHPQRIYDFAEMLIQRGYNDDHITMVLGGNFKRALSEIFTD